LDAETLAKAAAQQADLNASNSNDSEYDSENENNENDSDNDNADRDHVSRAVDQYGAITFKPYAALSNASIVIPPDLSKSVSVSNLFTSFIISSVSFITGQINIFSVI
jgi:hypothetical protein